MPYILVILLDPMAWNPLNLCMTLTTWDAVKKEINFVSVTGS